MATVMTSHRHGGAPPLPSRTPNNTNNRSIQRSQSAFEDVNQHARQPQRRNLSFDEPPPVPPSTYKRAPVGSQGGVANKIGGANGTGPPLLPRRPSTDKDPITRKSFETKSFINRHTARAYSQPEDDAPPPPPPPSTKTLPKRKDGQGKDQRFRDVYDAEDPYGQHSHKIRIDKAPDLPPGRHLKSSTATSYQDKPPNLPPGRPLKSSAATSAYQDKPPELPPGRYPKTSAASSTVQDFESRFHFHDAKDFPEPGAMEHSKKSYPSLSQSVRTHQQPDPRRIGYL